MLTTQCTRQFKDEFVVFDPSYFPLTQTYSCTHAHTYTQKCTHISTCIYMYKTQFRLVSSFLFKSWSLQHLLPIKLVFSLVSWCVSSAAECITQIIILVPLSKMTEHFASCLIPMLHCPLCCSSKVLKLRLYNFLYTITPRTLSAEFHLPMLCIIFLFLTYFLANFKVRPADILKATLNNW